MVRRSTTLVALALVAMPWPALGADAVAEAPLKAAFVEKFTHYVDWPTDRVPPPDQPFVLCLHGDDAVGRSLAELARTRSLKGRRVELRRNVSSQGLEACHVLWVAASESLPDLAAKTIGQPILTVGDGADAARRGLVIGLVRRGARLAFEVNLETARRGRLQVSSQLLRLASWVSGDVR